MNKTPDAGQNILTRNLPKTGQIIQYQAGDDGTYEAGWWKGRLNANNRQRFIAKTIAGDDIVFDRATGLMWPADGNGAGCYNGGGCNWPAAIVYCNGLNFAGFTDWRLSNCKELYSITDAGLTPCILQPPFSNIKTDEVYWTSTTRNDAILHAILMGFIYPSAASGLKTVAHYLRAVRKGI